MSPADRTPLVPPSSRRHAPAGPPSSGAWSAANGPPRSGASGPALTGLQDLAPRAPLTDLAAGRPDARAVGAEHSLQLGPPRGRHLGVEVPQLVRIPREVVILTVPVLVLHVQLARGPHRRVRGRVTAVFEWHVRVVLLEFWS